MNRVLGGEVVDDGDNGLGGKEEEKVVEELHGAVEGQALGVEKEERPNRKE